MNSTASKVFMVKPQYFGFNEETADDNKFQRRSNDANYREKSIYEFEAYTTLLKENGIEVVIVDDTENPHTPDSVFPNNWFSTHEDGSLVLYPMCSKIRRQERKPEFIEIIKKSFDCKRVIDLSHFENEGYFLEGTGSMVLDRNNKVAYACHSPRTSEKVLNAFCKEMGYIPIIFDSVDENNDPIYHTNVMLSIGESFVILCEESIGQKDQLESVINSLNGSGKEIISISLKQLHCFAGNCLQLKNKNGVNILVMSTTAKNSLNIDQISKLESYCKIITPDIPTIETIGGGSARCMMAELY